MHFNTLTHSQNTHGQRRKFSLDTKIEKLWVDWKKREKFGQRKKRNYAESLFREAKCWTFRESVCFVMSEKACPVFYHHRLELFAVYFTIGWNHRLQNYVNDFLFILGHCLLGMWVDFRTIYTIYSTLY